MCVCGYYSGTAAADWAQSASYTTPTCLQPDAGHKSTASADTTQELPNPPIDCAVPCRALAPVTMAAAAVPYAQSVELIASRRSSPSLIVVCSFATCYRDWCCSCYICPSLDKERWNMQDWKMMDHLAQLGKQQDRAFLCARSFRFPSPARRYVVSSAAVSAPRRHALTHLWCWVVYSFRLISKR